MIDNRGKWRKDIGFCHSIDGNVTVTSHNQNMRSQVWTIPGSWLCCLDWTPLVCSHSPSPFLPAPPPQGYPVAAVWCHCEHSNWQKQLKGERSQALTAEQLSSPECLVEVVCKAADQEARPGVKGGRGGATPGAGSNLQSPLPSDLFIVGDKFCL